MYDDDKYIICDTCDDEMSGDRKVYETDFSGNRICAECYLNQYFKPEIMQFYFKGADMRDMEAAADMLAEMFDDYVTTAGELIENDEELAMEEKEMARRYE